MKWTHWLIVVGLLVVVVVLSILRPLHPAALLRLSITTFVLLSVVGYFYTRMHRRL